MSDRRLAFIYSPEIEGLSYPPDCPFKTQRVGLTRQKLISFGLLGGEGRAEVPARRATLTELNRLHSDGYLDELQRAARGDLTPEGFRMGLGGPDTPVFKDMFEYGAWASGAGLTAADVLLAVAACIVGFDFGGNFALFPSATADLFGAKNLGVNYGWVITSYGIAGVVGITAGNAARVFTGGYSTAFSVAAVLCLISAGLAVALRFVPKPAQVKSP